MADELVHAGKWLHFYKRGSWEFVRRHKAFAVVAIAALTDNNEVVLIEQERRVLGANGRRVVEMPAGLVGDQDADDTIIDAARRELIEECGYEAKEIEVMGCGPSSAGLTDELITTVRARGLTKMGAGGGVDGEDIETILVPLDQVRAYLAQREAAGDLVDPKVYAGLFFLI